MFHSSLFYSENFWKDKEKEELQDYYDYDYS